jgi:predicted component of type VI protein secretion system
MKKIALTVAFALCGALAGCKSRRPQTLPHASRILPGPRPT